MAKTVLFSRYRLIAPVGTGGSAEVWRAVDQKTGDEVAVKRLHPIVVADEAGRARLQREFEALRALDEPHIVRVRDLHLGKREAALVLDYVDGPSVAQRLASTERGTPAFAPEEAVGIVSDIAAALSAAHAAGIVHRDVTPGNILLAPDGEARLTDFGIAHGEADATAVTATGQLMGTMRYLAPEQLRGAPSTPASDLHSLAAVAYEMLSGRHAYDVTSPVALAEAQAAGPPPIPGVSPDVDAVVRQGLAVDPADRPPSVAAFASALEAAIATDVTRAMPIADEIAVASPSRAAATHGAMPPAIGLADRPRTPFGRRIRGMPAAVIGLLGLLLAVGVLAAATSTDSNFGASTPGANVSAPSARPTPKPTAAPTKPPKGDHGHGNGNGGGGGD
ncbi:MAG TPA: serine/threonine-protein kinase [Candidatus Limnocylindrales bacterium]|nr:serine/threonine-protein kinase [Candidatus Limnocylindrales bacterium]